MPRLRRLRRAQGGAVLPARPRAAQGEHRLRLRHRLLLAVPLLPRHLRDALDPRPRAGDRDRHRHLARGPLGLGGHRRRRRALDRRQPPDPRDAPQREPEDPAVQQPDLRPDQGPVLPHLRARQGHQVDAGRLGGPPVQPGLARARRRGHLRRPHRSTPTASTSPRCSRRPPPTAAPALVEIYQNCPIFNDGAFDAIKSPDTKADAIIPLEQGQPIRFGVPTTTASAPRASSAAPVAASRSSRRPTSTRPTCWSTTPTTPTRRPRSRSPGSPTPACCTSRRSASSARSSGRRTTTRRARRSPRPPRARATSATRPRRR